MFLRYARWSVASLATLAAICFSPTVSRADTQILVEEINSSGNVIVGTTQIFASSTNITTSLSNFQSVTITANSNSGAVSSLTTTVNAIPISSGFDASIGIRVIVTSDGFFTPNAGGTATVSNNASASSAISGGQNMLTANTQLLNDPLTTPTSSGSAQATGSNLGSATGAASDIRPSGGVSPTTTSTINSFPNSFAIQQEVDVRAVNVGASGVASGSTLGGSASSLVSTSPAPVPAPGGLVLALAAAPAFGLRRVLRKRAAV